MILKQLVEVYNFDIVSFLFKQYKKLELSLEQTLVLMNIFSLLQSRKVVSLNTISKGINLNNAELSEILNELIENGWINTSLEFTKGGKQREVFDIDPTYLKLESFLTTIEPKETKDTKDISLTIQILEKTFNRLLKTNELEIVRHWFDNKITNSQEVNEIIKSAKVNPSIFYIDKVLSQKNVKINMQKNEKVEKAINKLFRN